MVTMSWSMVLSKTPDVPTLVSYARNGDLAKRS